MTPSGTRRKTIARYLYTCGTLIQLYDERRDGFRIGESCDVTLGFADLVIVAFDDPTPLKGRIVVQNEQNRAFMKLARAGKVTAILADVRAGTPTTQRAKLAVQTVRLEIRFSNDKTAPLEWCEIPALLGPVVIIDVKAPPLAHDKLVLGAMWQGYRIAKLTDSRNEDRPTVADMKRGAE